MEKNEVFKQDLKHEIQMQIRPDDKVLKVKDQFIAKLTAELKILKKT